MGIFGGFSEGEGVVRIFFFLNSWLDFTLSRFYVKQEYRVLALVHMIRRGQGTEMEGDIPPPILKV